MKEVNDDYNPYDTEPCPHGFTGYCPGCEARHNPRYGYYQRVKSPRGRFNSDGEYFEPNCNVHQGHTNPNWYGDLGINPPTSLKQIKKAYHKKALVHHPDKGGGEEDFKKISEAYQNLCNIYN